MLLELLDADRSRDWLLIEHEQELAPMAPLQSHIKDSSGFQHLLHPRHSAERAACASDVQCDSSSENISL